MKQIHIKQKLKEIGVELDNVSLGDFDYIGEFTAKCERKSGNENYDSVGAYYRSNYERGILIYNLICQYDLTSMLEIGFGRGYATFCAAKAFHDLGIKGQIITIDPNFDEKFLQALSGVLNKEWFNYIKFIKGTSQQVLPTMKEDNFDLIYIDGDHSYTGTKYDWNWSKDRYEKFLLFDEYHLSTKIDPGIQYNQLIDEIDDESKELIIMDRRIFLDERGIKDEDIDYGQVLLTKPGVQRDDW